MKDKDKTREQPISELVEMHQRITELKTSETEHKRAEQEVKAKVEGFHDLVGQELKMKQMEARLGDKQISKER